MVQKRPPPTLLVSRALGFRAYALGMASEHVSWNVWHVKHALIQHGKLRVSTCLEDGERLVAPRQLIVATATVIGGVTSGTHGAVERRVFAMDIVLPARGVRSRQHHGVARST